MALFRAIFIEFCVLSRTHGLLIMEQNHNQALTLELAAFGVDRGLPSACLVSQHLVDSSPSSPQVSR